MGSETHNRDSTRDGDEETGAELDISRELHAIAAILSFAAARAQEIGEMEAAIEIDEIIRSIGDRISSLE